MKARATRISRTNSQPTATTSNNSNTERKLKRQRLPLNCGECRKKKLSCDRQLPCHRCIRAGRPEKCCFDTDTGKPACVNPQFVQRDSQRHDHEIRELQAQVAELKRLLTKLTSSRETIHTGEDTLEAMSENTIVSQAQIEPSSVSRRVHGDSVGTRNPATRRPTGYYNQHSLFRFFSEIPQLWPFIEETTNQFLKPVGVYLNKPKDQAGTEAALPQGTNLRHLLPCKSDTDILTSYYINHLSSIHRILHVPTLQKEYTTFWITAEPRPATTILILSILAISVCLINPDSTPLSASYQHKPLQWIPACESWLHKQNTKHRQLIHYQVKYLILIAKRANMVRKKDWWTESGSLVQDAILDGLHVEDVNDGVYMREMKKRIWLAVRELDLQSGFEFGLPTLLHNVDDDADIATLDDAEFDEKTEVAGRNTNECMPSFQMLCSQSWKIRLHISHSLVTGMTYDEVLKHTHELTQMIHALPCQNTESNEAERKCVLEHACLKFQLQTCILALHRPYLAQGKHWISMNTVYIVSQDMLLLNTKLAKLGFQGFALLREDVMLAALTLTRITLHIQDSTNIITANAKATTSLMEDCLPFTEDRYLRSSASEPWCYITLCSAIMLLKVHTGSEDRQSSMATCAQKFLDLHYRRVGRQRAWLLQQDETHVNTGHDVSEMDVSYDICVNPFEWDIGLAGWEPWGTAWSTLPLQ